MALPLFQQYQLQFAGHIRNPVENKKPDRVSADRMRVYTEIVFNNLESSVSACFPICKNIVGARNWERLVREFFAQHQCSSPLFRKIPEEFLEFLQTVEYVPAFLYSLAHYEWIELAVSVDDSQVDLARLDTQGDLLDGLPFFAPSLKLLSYAYPVHLISPNNQPTEPSSQVVHLLVFRNAEDNVRFIETNPITAALLQRLQNGEESCRMALAQMAEELQHPDPESVLRFGIDILGDLRQQGAILGVRR
ncbi:MAG TPA: putative DNA-binding domain-containing protein [Methylophilaceae bacterium]|nr:putative DNA-binding domain-containing protein [Methylophilaceae bacterium]